MNIHLGLRTLALLALVAASTAVLVTPELFKGSKTDTGQVIRSMLVVGHN